MYYFAYASNLSRNQMKERCPESKPLFNATLHNYRIVFTGWSRKWRGGIATIRYFRGDRVKGGVYKVSEECLKRMDKYENNAYQRLNVTVNNEDNEPVEAITYINNTQTDESKPSTDYLAIIRRGYKDWRLI
jgi:gamma-glutamylcyclotransferase